MGLLSVETPRDLSRHYKETRARLWQARPKPSFAPPPQPIVIAIRDANEGDSERLRAENNLFRAFLSEHGVKIDDVLHKKPDLSPIQPTLRQIIEAVGTFYKVSRIDLLSNRRTADLNLPRHIVFYLARQLTVQALPQIGRSMNRDHTSVLHGARRIKRKMRDDSDLAHDVALIIESLGLSS